MIHDGQRETPDTCAHPASGDACVYIVSWDDAVDPSARVHTLVRFEQKCSLHAGLSDAACYARITDENRRKNLTRTLFHQNLKSMDGADSTGKYLDLFDGRWSIDEVGLLTVNVSGLLTSQQKTQAQNLVDTRFGVGKVRLV